MSWFTHKLGRSANLSGKPIGMSRRKWNAQKITEARVARMDGYAKGNAGKPSSLERITIDILESLKLPFRKQQIIGNYIVDFALPHKLIIEVDGPHHDQPSRRSYESRRDNYLKARGFTVLHIHWTEFEQDENLVQLAIEQFVSGVIDAGRNVASIRGSEGETIGNAPKTEAA